MDRFGLVMLGVLTGMLAGCGAETGEALPEPARTAANPPAAYTASPAVGDSGAPVSEAASEPAAAGAAVPGRPAAARVQPAGAATPSAPVVATAPDAAVVLSRAERAYEGIRSMEADFVQEVTVPLLDTTQRSRGKIYHRRPDRFLMKFSQPEGDVVVADGQYLWMYYPSTDPKQVLRTRVGNGQQVDLHKEFLANAADRYHASLDGSETVAGHETDVLVLTPKAPSSYRRVRIWVDRDDSLVRRFEIIEENESVRLLELRNLKPNATLADALFRFTPPPGAQVFEQ